METTNIVDFTRRDGMSDALTELLKTGAQQLIAQQLRPSLSVIWRNLPAYVLRTVTRLWFAMGTILPDHFRRALAL
jgi:hypothetical protein